MAPLLMRKAQIAIEEESVEGTAETLVAADAGIRVYEPSFTANIDRFKRTPARTTLSQLAAVVGKQVGEFSFKTELKGSGAVGTIPSFDDALRACGFARSVVESIAVGAVSGGPYVPGETITGGTSGATGRVVGEGAATPINFVVLSGTFASGEVITGGTSGATSTSSATPTAAQGFEYLPVSSSVPSATIGYYLDGVRKLLFGARGSVSIEATNGEPVFLSFSFQGVYGGVADVALLSGVTFETTVPPAFLNVGASVHGLSAVFGAMTLDIANTIAIRESANATLGVLSAFISGREPTGSIDPEMAIVADHDFYGKLASGATGRLFAEIGSAAGNKVTLGCPLVQYAGVGEGDRDGLALATLDLDLISASPDTGDDELQIGLL